MKEVLQFEPATHRYTLDGRNLPSVTSVLSDCCMVDYQWAQTQHAARGTATHELCAEIALLERPESQFEWDGTCNRADGIGYGRSYQAFLRHTGMVVDPDLIEFPVASLVMQYAGTVDQVLWRQQERVLVDLKSGEPQDAAALQLAGYRIALKEWKGISVQASYCLWLNKDGKFPKVVEPKDPLADERIWMSLMEVWHWRRAHGVLPKR